jgi:hypothetical protein
LLGVWRGLGYNFQRRIEALNRLVAFEFARCLTEFLYLVGMTGGRFACHLSSINRARVMAQEYIIYCDESEETGRYFSNFYGGALVRSEHLEEIKALIASKKAELNLFGEIKWTKITENYADKYIALMDLFFDLIKADRIKIRIMFTQNMNVPVNLTKRHIDEKYFILYFQFMKHAFGLHCSPIVPDGVTLRIYPDRLPDTVEKVAQFRSFLVGLSRTGEFRQRQIKISLENVAEVHSHDHDILQCLDVIVGAMHFKLNDKHREKTAKNGTRRGKRTKAKERVYRQINKRIQDIYPRFNVGTSTAQPAADSRWAHPYRHWLFKPRERIVNPISKKKKAGTP